MPAPNPFVLAHNEWALLQPQGHARFPYRLRQIISALCWRRTFGADQQRGNVDTGTARISGWKNRKDSVDWIVLQGEQAALFLECKAKRLTWASKVGLSNLAALEQDIRKLAGAVVQVYKTIRDYREGRYPHLAYVEAIKVYPAIATLEDWYLFGHDLPNAPARRISPTRSCRCCSCPDSPYNLITTIVAMMDRPPHVSSVGATSRAVCTRAAISGVIGSRCGTTRPML